MEMATETIHTLTRFISLKNQCQSRLPSLSVTPALKRECAENDRTMKGIQDGGPYSYSPIILDASQDKVLLAQSGWGFQKGKVNEDEAPHDYAVREVMEETGFEIKGLHLQEQVHRAEDH
jgi:hypothetical protein